MPFPSSTPLADRGRGNCYHIYCIGLQVVFIHKGHPSLLDDIVGGSLQPVLISEPWCGHLGICRKLPLSLILVVGSAIHIPFWSEEIYSQLLPIYMEKSNFWKSKSLERNFPSVVCAFLFHLTLILLKQNPLRPTRNLLSKKSELLLLPLTIRITILGKSIFLLTCNWKSNPCPNNLNCLCMHYATFENFSVLLPLNNKIPFSTFELPSWSLMLLYHVKISSITTTENYFPNC